MSMALVWKTRTATITEQAISRLRRMPEKAIVAGDEVVISWPKWMDALLIWEGRQEEEEGGVS